MHALVITFFLAMLPVLELRGAIPIGTAQGLSPLIACAASVAGNMVPVPFIILFIRKIMKLLRARSEKLNALVTRIEKRAMEKADTVRKYEELGLIILVAIPLPGTGAWTGALVAALMDLQLKRALPCIFLGVLAAGAIVTGITAGVIAVA